MAIERIEGIVIDTIKHNDRHNVVTLFTRTRGRMSFLSPAGAGKSGRIRKARLLPLSVIETQVNIKQNKDLHNLGSITPLEIWHEIYFNPVKSSLTFFISEFLNRYLRDASPEPALWEFIIGSIRALDTLEAGTANFHIWFLIHFLNIAGITPDLSDYEPGDRFDMRAGNLVGDTSYHKDTLTSAETAILIKLSRISLSNLRAYRFTGAERRLLLDHILRYYAIHFPGLSSLRSPDILSEVFSS